MGTTAVSKTPSLWKTFLVFLAPLMLSNALQSLFGTVSNALLGQMIGVDALAAVSVFFPVTFVLFAFVMGLSTGSDGWCDAGTSCIPQYYVRHNTVDAPTALRHNAPKHRGDFRELKSAIPVRFRQPQCL